MKVYRLPIILLTLFFAALSAVVVYRGRPIPPRTDPATSTKERPWMNSLGMKFVPVTGTGVIFSVWETRRQDYVAYAKANTGVNESWTTVGHGRVPLEREADHPVVGVSWEDAEGFCRWLTEKERRDGYLGAVQSYRLPMDEEWSVAAGLARENGASAKEKDEGIKDVYPWGSQWPPPSRAGNYADSAAKAKFGGWTVIDGYSDGYATTSPVGKYTENTQGLYDMGGNVWEWCEDWYDPSAKEWRVLRGASWRNYGAVGLWSSVRHNLASTRRDIDFGFRVVLAGGSSP